MTKSSLPLGLTRQKQLELFFADDGVWRQDLLFYETLHPDVINLFLEHSPESLKHLLERSDLSEETERALLKTNSTSVLFRVAKSSRNVGIWKDCLKMNGALALALASNPHLSEEFTKNMLDTNPSLPTCIALASYTPFNFAQEVLLSHPNPMVQEALASSSALSLDVARKLSFSSNPVVAEELIYNRESLKFIDAEFSAKWLLHPANRRAQKALKLERGSLRARGIELDVWDVLSQSWDYSLNSLFKACKELGPEVRQS